VVIGQHVRDQVLGPAALRQTRSAFTIAIPLLASVIAYPPTTASSPTNFLALRHTMAEASNNAWLIVQSSSVKEVLSDELHKIWTRMATSQTELDRESKHILYGNLRRYYRR
jgi:hypothetical protein